MIFNDTYSIHCWYPRIIVDIPVRSLLSLTVHTLSRGRRLDEQGHGTFRCVNSQINIFVQL